MLYLGRSLTPDAPDAYLDDSHSRAVLICGKRGSGKSYTMGVLLEELITKGNTLVVVIDPMGIYHGMSLPNTTQQRVLWDWGLKAKPMPVLSLTPGDPEEQYGGAAVVQSLAERGVRVRPLRLNPADLAPDSWCDLFDININDASGNALYRAVQTLARKRPPHFSLPDIMRQITQDSRVRENTRDALLARLNMALDWNLFTDHYQEITQLFDPSAINVIDLSVLDPGRYGLRALVVDVVARALFRHRVLARRKEELGLPTDMPKVWLCIDEAHQFVPSGRSTLAKETLIRWAKEGRQPGLSLILASQQPSALDNEVLSQCDAILAQKLTNRDDLQALNRLSYDYMSDELKAYIRTLHRTGQAVLVDDEQEQVAVIAIRPRHSHHGGNEVAGGG